MDLGFTNLNGVADYVFFILGCAVAVASYRRCRCLSGYPIWRSVLIGLLSGFYAGIWVIMSAYNRKRIVAEWDDYRNLHRKSPTPAL